MRLIFQVLFRFAFFGIKSIYLITKKRMIEAKRDKNTTRISIAIQRDNDASMPGTSPFCSGLEHEDYFYMMYV